MLWPDGLLLTIKKKARSPQVCAFSTHPAAFCTHAHTCRRAENDLLSRLARPARRRHAAASASRLSSRTARTSAFRLHATAATSIPPLARLLPLAASSHVPHAVRAARTLTRVPLSSPYPRRWAQNRCRLVLSSAGPVCSSARRPLDSPTRLRWALATAWKSYPLTPPDETSPPTLPSRRFRARLALLRLNENSAGSPGPEKLLSAAAATAQSCFVCRRLFGTTAAAAYPDPPAQDARASSPWQRRRRRRQRRARESDAQARKSAASVAVSRRRWKPRTTAFEEAEDARAARCQAPKRWPSRCLWAALRRSEYS